MNIIGLDHDSALKPLRYALLCSLMALSFGFDLGTMLVKQSWFGEYFVQQGREVSVITGTYVLGMLLGLFLGGWLNYGSGRRLCILSGSSLGLAAIFTSMFAPNLSILLCTQLVIGFAFGLYLLSVALYIPEISAPQLRGMLCSIPLLCLSAGALTAVMIWDHSLFTSSPVFLLFFCSFNFIAIVIGIVKLPESPRYLAGTELPDAALNVLFKLRSSMSAAARELAGINECCRLEARGAQFFLQNQHFRRSFWTILVLAMLLHACGFGILPHTVSDLYLFSRSSPFYHSQDFIYILYKSGFTVIFFGILTTGLMADRIGRRTLLFMAALLSNVSLGALLMCALFGNFFFAPLFITLGVLLYIYSMIIALMVILFMLLPELMPSRGREFALSSVLLCFTAAILFGLQAYDRLTDILGFEFMLLLFFIFSLIFTATSVLVPNSAGLSLELLENRLLEGTELSRLGRRDRRQ